MKSLLLAICALLAPSALARSNLEVVPHVDVERYMGTWFEIASKANWFLRGCVDSEAHYSLNDNGTVAVLNSCHDKGPEGRVRSVNGVARVVDSDTNAKLKVRFFWPFSGNYWIIELDDDYQYAVVGEPSRKYLWILSRDPVMDPAVLTELQQRLVDVHGYNIDDLKFTRSQLP